MADLAGPLLPRNILSGLSSPKSPSPLDPRVEPVLRINRQEWQKMLSLGKADETDPEGNTLLHRVIEGKLAVRGALLTYSKEDLAKEALDGKFFTEKGNQAGLTPFQLAVEQKQYRLAELLLKNGANSEASWPNGTFLATRLVSDPTFNPASFKLLTQKCLRPIPSLAISPDRSRLNSPLGRMSKDPRWALELKNDMKVNVKDYEAMLPVIPYSPEIRGLIEPVFEKLDLLEKVRWVASGEGVLNVRPIVPDNALPATQMICRKWDNLPPEAQLVYKNDREYVEKFLQKLDPALAKNPDLLFDGYVKLMKASFKVFVTPYVGTQKLSVADFTPGINFEKGISYDIQYRKDLVRGDEVDGNKVTEESKKNVEVLLEKAFKSNIEQFQRLFSQCANQIHIDPTSDRSISKDLFSPVLANHGCSVRGPSTSGDMVRRADTARREVTVSQNFGLNILGGNSDAGYVEFPLFKMTIVADFSTATPTLIYTISLLDSG